MKQIVAKIPLQDIHDLNVANTKYMEVALRLELNRQGIRFADDGRPSLLENYRPEPLGHLIHYKCSATGMLYYVQFLEDDV